MNKQFLKRLKVEICLGTLRSREITVTLIHDLWDKNEDGILLCMHKNYRDQLIRDQRFITAEYLEDIFNQIKQESSNRPLDIDQHRVEDETEFEYYNV